MNSVHLPQFEDQTCSVLEERQWAGIFDFLEREREHLLSRIPADRTVDFRQSKKQSCSTRQGLRVDTDLVEFRQLQEVGIFSFLCYSLAKSHVNG